MPHKQVEGYPSVTEVLSVIRKPWLERWYGKYGNDKCEKIQKTATNIGTKVHEEIQRRFEGKEFKTKNSNIKRMVNNFFEKFANEYNIKPLSMEPKEPLIDKVNGYSGTYDAIIMGDDEEIMVADWKTSNQLDKVTVPLQLAAYANLIGSVNYGIAIRIDKKKDVVDIETYPHLQRFFFHFLSCLDLYNYMKGMEHV